MNSSFTGSSFRSACAFLLAPEGTSATPRPASGSRLNGAYETLSDRNERKWYDDHREDILRGRSVDDDSDSSDYSSDDGGGGRRRGKGGVKLKKREVNLWGLFSGSAFDGFGDDERSFTASGGARSTVSSEEARPSAAAEAENKRERKAAKSAFQDMVRQLAAFVRKRDPRGARRGVAGTAREGSAAEAAKARKRQENLDARIAWRERAQEAQAYEVRSGVILGEEAGDGSGGSDDAAEVEVFACGPCKKTFKSLKQFENHRVSKAHKKKAGPNWCPPARAERARAGGRRGSEDLEAKFDAGFFAAPAAEAADEEADEAAEAPADEAADEAADSDPKKKGGKKGKKKGKHAESSDDESASMKCTGCSATFPSRSKLVAHLKANPGHAKRGILLFIGGAASRSSQTARLRSLPDSRARGAVEGARAGP
ncbi:zinc ion binding protein [Aureococcus anophagefferens]|nr:zinc ion binding protein [Aureococcus anophagefferens]